MVDLSDKSELPLSRSYQTDTILEIFDVLLRESAISIWTMHPSSFMIKVQSR